MMYFSKIKYFFISFIFLSSKSFCMKLKLDDGNNFSENRNINQDCDTNQKEGDNIKANGEKLNQLADIYLCLHDILVNLGFNKDYTECYYIGADNNKDGDFLCKIINEVITPLEEFIKKNCNYMKGYIIFDWENSGTQSYILNKINEAIGYFRNIYKNQGEGYKKGILQTTSILDKLMRMGCYIMDVLILHYNEIYKCNKIKKTTQAGKFSDGFKALFKKDVISFDDVENRYKNLVLDLMKLYILVLDFNELIGEHPGDGNVFSDEKFKCAPNLILNVFRNFYYVFLFSVKFNLLDLIVENIIDSNNKLDFYIKNIFGFTYCYTTLSFVFLNKFVSRKYDHKVNCVQRFIFCLRCLLSLLCDVEYFSENNLSDKINKNLENLRAGNDINEDFLSSIRFNDFINNCQTILSCNVSINKELNDQMDNLDTKIIEDNDVMSISDYSSIPRVSVPLKEIVDNNGSGDCVSCRSKVQITDRIR